MSNNEKLGTIIHGIGASEVIDSSGEIISIEGIDTSSLDVDALINTEHESKTTSQLIGKVLSYKKIFKKEDCENEHHRHFWDKVEAPYLYIKAVLFDKFGHTGAQDAVAMMKFDKSLNKEDTRQVCGFSIEGSRLDKEGNKITKCIARKISWTAYPCNKTCVAEILEEDDKPIEITAKQLLAAFKKSERIESDLHKTEINKSKFFPKQTKEFSSIVPEPKAHKPEYPYQPQRTFTSDKAPKKLRVGDRITYPQRPKLKSSTYKDPSTWKSEQNGVRKTIIKSMTPSDMRTRMMLSEDKENMRKDILKNLADDAFEHFEKKEQLVEFVKSQYPDMTEQEVLAFAKTYAYVQMKKSEMEMVKIANEIEGSDLQKAVDYERGVQPPISRTSGTSKAGLNLAVGQKEKAKKYHEKNLANLKQMPSPNLPKSEESSKDKNLKNKKPAKGSNQAIVNIRGEIAQTNKWRKEHDSGESDKNSKQLKEMFGKSSKGQESEKMQKKDRCWEGYEPTPGKKAYSKGSCKPIKKKDPKTEEIKIDLKKPIEKTEVPSNEIHLYKYEDGTAEIIWGSAISNNQVEDIIKTELDGWQENLDFMEKKEKPFEGYNPKKHSKTGGLNDSFREKYNKEHGSHLKRPVTGKVKAGSKASKRRKSFCARMSGVKGPTSKEGKLTPKGASLKRWKC